MVTDSKYHTSKKNSTFPVASCAAGGLAAHLHRRHLELCCWQHPLAGSMRFRSDYAPLTILEALLYFWGRLQLPSAGSAAPEQPACRTAACNCTAAFNLHANIELLPAFCQLIEIVLLPMLNASLAGMTAAAGPASWFDPVVTASL